MDARKPNQLKQEMHRRPPHRCPACHRRIVVSDVQAGQRLKFFPFCCERCKLIDLGAWLDGDYRIPARPDDPPDEVPTDETSR